MLGRRLYSRAILNMYLLMSTVTAFPLMALGLICVPYYFEVEQMVSRNWQTIQEVRPDDRPIESRAPHRTLLVAPPRRAARAAESRRTERPRMNARQVAPQDLSKGSATRKLQVLLILLGVPFVGIALFKILPYALTWRLQRCACAVVPADVAIPRDDAVPEDVVGLPKQHL